MFRRTTRLAVVPLAAILLTGMTACQKDADDSATPPAATGSPSEGAAEPSADSTPAKDGRFTTDAALTAALLGEGELPSGYAIEDTGKTFADSSTNSVSEAVCEMLIADPATSGSKPAGAKATRTYAPGTDSEPAPSGASDEESPMIALMLVHRPRADHLTWLKALQDAFQACERFTASSGDDEVYEFETGHEDYDMYGPNSFEYRMTVSYEGADVHYLFDYTFVEDVAIVTRATFRSDSLATSDAVREIIRAQTGKLGGPAT